MENEEAQRYLNEITCGLRDALTMPANKQNTELAIDYSYRKMLDLIAKIGFENPEIKRARQLKERIEELAAENRDYRHRLGLQEPTLPLMYDDDD